MNRLACLFATLAGAALAFTANAAPSASEFALARASARDVVQELSRACPVRAVNDRGAFESCRKTLYGDSRFRKSLKTFILWGRPLNGDISAPLKEFRTTQFGPDVFSGTYAPMWMFNDDFEFEYVEKEKVYRAIVGAGFRNELEFGQYPYPFWHDAKKWTDYEDANAMAFWIDPITLKIQQMTFFKRAERPAVAKLERRHMPTFDGKWMWVDAKGNQQPAPMLFRGLFRDGNPHLKELDDSYRKFALSLRDSDCMACHVPNNPDKMRRLVLLQTPLHAASEIERVIKDVEKDRMPLDDSGIEKPLDAALKERLLKDARDFARVIAAAKTWEQQVR
jgi:hypothetical protein